MDPQDAPFRPGEERLEPGNVADEVRVVGAPDPADDGIIDAHVVDEPSGSPAPVAEPDEGAGLPVAAAADVTGPTDDAPAGDEAPVPPAELAPPTEDAPPTEVEAPTEVTAASPSRGPSGSTVRPRPRRATDPRGGPRRRRRPRGGLTTAVR